ncbi:GDNF-inducible zinc finger protein 1 isoform X2 [Procambarus clarkii]|nr:zinc finger protein 37-like isoform X2 [Procambarus clarkii]XP_045604768.1 zinc finger protein 37-like isoform X2 [Procambarus clarkii]XP_045604769.1 zinc finger protein 37-like isoform X2 [Procambarus clarkii]
MVDICIKSVGGKGLRDHEITGRHKQKANDRPLPPPPPQLNNAVYPVLEVEAGVEQHGGELLGSPRPATPQTPNTPLSTHRDDLPHPQTPLLDFGTQLPTTTSQSSASKSTGPPARTAIVQPKVGESLVIEYDDPNKCNTTLPPASKSTNGPTVSIKRETEENVTVTTDDLTCNVCGQEYAQWTQLKKHLVDHILMAQNSADPKTKVNTRGRGRTPSSKNSGRPPRAVKAMALNQQKPVADPDESSKTKRRGRPPGSRNKSRTTSSNPQVNHPLPRRTVRQRTVQRVSTVQEDAVDDPLCVESDACEMTVNDSHITVKEHKEEEELEEEEASEEEANDIPGCEDEADGSGKRKPGPLQCRVCRVVFYNRGELREHQRSEHNNGRPYQCSHCQKFFTTKNHMEVHVRHKHTSGPNPCQCAMCGKVLSSRTNLRIHMRIHKGERPFECPVCHKAFSRKANMEMHLVYHTGERRFTCEICGQSFFAINALKRHTKLHTGERDYACEICGATYVTGTDLRRHRLKHDEVKPFPCQLCEKQFTRSHDLKVHVRYHNKELRYTCDVCNKQFVESGNYKRHMRRHTGERPYTCGICLLTFSQVHHLKTHLRTNHSEEASASEESSQGATSGRGRLPPHRNPRIPCRHIPKPPQMQQPPIHPSHGHPHPHSHLTPHPHGVGSGGTGVAVHSGQPISPPMAHSGTVPGSVASTHTTQIPASGGVNHPAAMSGFLHGYNSHIYNHSVMPHYPALFDMCPPQNCVNHLPTH